MVQPVVEIEGEGPGGRVIYREGDFAHSFGWELGTGNVLATLYVPSPAQWEAKLPWAAGRREEAAAALARPYRACAAT